MVEQDEKDLKRYRWLRDQQGMTPDQFDSLLDSIISGQCKEFLVEPLDKWVERLGNG